ncbi:AAA family ATPase [Blautia sp. MSJ-19]|uniref:AAA family ATPase n=1 Tax=Blautia sp. MSJ-19 TaxID=2841517 RepID=UPI001C0ED56B|nr:MoxR family ATPase [Blautia sp. MSJ-19]MBU5482288.1 MoxR family ATPase [Blautia sp. MSJ-19]
MENKKTEEIMKEVRKVIFGKDNCIRQVMTAILAGGHILIEDIPGIGKTSMALAFARAMNLTQNRVQFTPDVLPSDITGFSMYIKEKEAFAYQPGAVMCNLFLADEINRTSAKTQSALLEVMEEGTVTVDGVTREVPSPFVVIATENPIGSAGTQKLPESQLDRFMICIKMGYPDVRDEVEILMRQSGTGTLKSVIPVVNAGELEQMQSEVEHIFIHETVCQYIVELVNATRSHELVSLGLSTRGAIAVTRMAKANAYMEGRNFVLPQDVTQVFPAVATHRLKCSARARMEQGSAGQIIEEILKSVRQPRPERKV